MECNTGGVSSAGRVSAFVSVVQRGRSRADTEVLRSRSFYGTTWLETIVRPGWTRLETRARGREVGGLVYTASGHDGIAVARDGEAHSVLRCTEEKVHFTRQNPGHPGHPGSATYSHIALFNRIGGRCMVVGIPVVCCNGRGPGEFEAMYYHS